MSFLVVCSMARIISICRKCDSPLYVGLMHGASPTHHKSFITDISTSCLSEGSILMYTFKEQQISSQDKLAVI